MGRSSSKHHASRRRTSALFLRYSPRKSKAEVASISGFRETMKSTKVGMRDQNLKRSRILTSPSSSSEDVAKNATMFSTNYSSKSLCRTISNSRKAYVICTKPGAREKNTKCRRFPRAIDPVAPFEAVLGFVKWAVFAYSVRMATAVSTRSVE